MLFAIFGDSWQNIPNTFPASAGITSRDLLAFMLFWIIQFPIMFIHPRRMRWVYVFKAVYTPACLFGVLGWAIAKNGGSVGDLSGLGPKRVEGGDLVWAMLQAINSVLGVSCPLDSQSRP
jgi:NCS1 family nucleobase:cation symporter-1